MQSVSQPVANDCSPLTDRLSTAVRFVLTVLLCWTYKSVKVFCPVRETIRGRQHLHLSRAGPAPLEGLLSCWESQHSLKVPNWSVLQLWHCQYPHIHSWSCLFGRFNQYIRSCFDELMKSFFFFFCDSTKSLQLVSKSTLSDQLLVMWWWSCSSLNYDQ